MSAWQPLPEELPAEVRHFVEQLRLLKDRTGMSLVALGTRTAYSKSSWQRYLNASQPPPRQAVVALCRVAGVAGEETERFGVRWELAVRAWPREPVSSVSSVPPVPPVRVPAGGPGPVSVPGGEPAPGAEASVPAVQGVPVAGAGCAARGRVGDEEDPTHPGGVQLDEGSSP
ncbi:helix-turn-helix transcriptional regulator, partial [Streptomyces mirabilis]